MMDRVGVTREEVIDLLCRFCFTATRLLRDRAS